MSRETRFGWWTGSYVRPPAGMRGRTQIYEFTNDPHTPLTYHYPVDPNNRNRVLLLRPDTHFLTDLGSIPHRLQWWFPPDEFERAYLMHDSAYEDHGLWMLCEGSWRFQALRRIEIESLLRDMVRSEGCGEYRAWMIWKAVLWFGRSTWDDRSETSVDKARKSTH